MGPRFRGDDTNMDPRPEIAETFAQLIALGMAAFAIIMLLVFTSTVLGTLMDDWRERRRRRALLIRRFPGGRI